MYNVHQGTTMLFPFFVLFGARLASKVAEIDNYITIHAKNVINTKVMGKWSH
jgi:hypothetical protein